MCRILLCATGTEASSLSAVAPVPVTVAVLTMLAPASSSACVTVWLAVYCQVSPTSNRLSWSMSPTLKAAGQNRRLVGRERIVHHHAGNRRIARVGHRQRVADRLAGHVGRATRNRGVLLDVQDLALRNRHRGVGGGLTRRQESPPVD